MRTFHYMSVLKDTSNAKHLLLSSTLPGHLTIFLYFIFSRLVSTFESSLLLLPTSRKISLFFIFSTLQFVSYYLIPTAFPSFLPKQPFSHQDIGYILIVVITEMLLKVALKY